MVHQGAYYTAVRSTASADILDAARTPAPGVLLPSATLAMTKTASSSTFVSVAWIWRRPGRRSMLCRRRRKRRTSCHAAIPGFSEPPWSFPKCLCPHSWRANAASAAMMRYPARPAWAPWSPYWGAIHVLLQAVAATTLRRLSDLARTSVSRQTGALKIYPARTLSGSTYQVSQMLGRSTAMWRAPKCCRSTRGTQSFSLLRTCQSEEFEALTAPVSPSSLV